MRAIKIGAVFFLVCGLVVASILWLGEGAVLFQSWESSVSTGAPIFNQVRFFPGLTRDIWMMNQSHHGLKAPREQWDRLAIVVDKSHTPSRAIFLQLPPGELKWNEELVNQGRSFRVSCYMCHSNGPRVLRPMDENNLLKFSQKLKIQLWNLRIKTYGRIVENSEHTVKDAILKIPFRLHGDRNNEKLHVKSCAKCHRDEIWWGRGFLTRQNFLAVEFMFRQGLMPPLGFEVTEEDRRAIEDFLTGF